MIGEYNVVAIIIGRAGSKGLPGKNALMLSGRPMIHHSIDHARRSTLIDRIAVSTDCEVIADAARSAGAGSEKWVTSSQKKKPHFNFLPAYSKGEIPSSCGSPFLWRAISSGA